MPTNKEPTQEYLKYAIELYQRNKHLDRISEMVGDVITAMKDSHLLIRTTYGTFIAKHKLTKSEIAKAEKTFTESYCRITKESNSKIKVVPFNESLEYQTQIGR